MWLLSYTTADWTPRPAGDFNLRPANRGTSPCPLPRLSPSAWDSGASTVFRAFFAATGLDVLDPPSSVFIASGRRKGKGRDVGLCTSRRLDPGWMCPVLTCPTVHMRHRAPARWPFARLLVEPSPAFWPSATAAPLQQF